MRTETVEVYKFDELNDSAKEKARDWYRERALDYEWWDFTDAKTIGALMGIEISNIYFSGFSYQGDGACFEGSYKYVKNSVAAVKAYAPVDMELHRIVEMLRDIQRPTFYQFSASVKQRGHYNHENCTDIEVYRDGEYSNIDEDDAIAEALRDYMRWIYKQLESEYEYQMSDETVDETIQCNEYEFNEDGTIH